MDPKDFLDQIRRDNEQRTRELLERKKAEALARGKEPFDFERLRSMAPTDALGSTTDEQQTLLERLYYVDHPEILTLREFADHVRLLSTWWT